MRFGLIGDAIEIWVFGEDRQAREQDKHHMGKEEKAKFEA
jgi:hypothetical protein